MRVEVDVKVMPGDKCLVLNYRKKGEVWEEGRVIQITASICTYVGNQPTYEVALCRKVIHKNGTSTIIMLHVGNKQIKPYDTSRSSSKN